MASNLKITSDFALLDVKKGRAKLAKHFASRPPLGPCPPDMRIPVQITGYIDSIYGHDDGTSQEFNVVVTSIRWGGR